MVSVFLYSVGLLSLFVLLRVIEIVRGARFANTTRSSWDAVYNSCTSALARQTQRYVEYVRRDVLVNVLHMVTYVALVAVRGIERRLVRTSSMLRSLGRSRSGVRKSRVMSRSNGEGV